MVLAAVAAVWLQVTLCLLAACCAGIAVASESVRMRQHILLFPNGYNFCFSDRIKSWHPPTDTTDMTVKPSQFDTLSRLIQATEQRHKVISNNIANVNTPGYIRRDISFEGVLKEQEQGETGELEVVNDTSTPRRADGNNVDIDMEMGQLNKNHLVHQTLVQVLSGQVRTMRSAITGQ